MTYAIQFNVTLQPSTHKGVIDVLIDITRIQPSITIIANFQSSTQLDAMDVFIHLT